MGIYNDDGSLEFAAQSTAKVISGSSTSHQNASKNLICCPIASHSKFEEDVEKMMKWNKPRRHY